MRRNVIPWLFPVAMMLLGSTARGQEAVQRYQTDEKVRIRVGTLAGVSDQPTEMAVGAGYDFVELSRNLRLAGDMTFGVYPLGFTVEPMFGLRVPFAIAPVPRIRPYVGALVGYNMSWDARFIRAAMPFRFQTGAFYDVRRGLGLGVELAMEVGPSFGPASGAYAAFHFGVGVAF